MSQSPQNLLPGEWVRVRSPEEIFATLDASGDLEGLPFLPEMLKYCGRKFRVFRRAHKTCDTVEWTGLRKLERTVHLALLRCDGSAHGGCQAGCLLFWKEAWLERCDAPEAHSGSPRNDLAAGAGREADDAQGILPANRQAAVLHEAELEAAQCQIIEGEPIYRCQATRLRKFTAPLPFWHLGQYLDDLRNGFSPWWVLRGLAISTWNRIQRRRDRPTYPNVRGQLKRTPDESLDLQPGEWVEVKSREEIQATLDAHGCNRGMTFDPEMLPYVGRRFQVLRRIEQIVDEPSGRLIRLRNPCIVLQDVVCTAKYHRFCPRSTFPYWREIWLRRVFDTPSPPTEEAERKTTRTAPQPAARAAG